MRPSTVESVPVEGGTRVSVVLTSMMRVLTREGSADFVRLTFRDDPIWGYDAALSLEDGAFDCPTGCRVTIAADTGATWSVPAAPSDAAHPTLSIRGPRELWYAIRGAQWMTVDFPAAGVGMQRATFDVSGLDRSRLDWDQQAYARTAAAPG